MCCSMTHRKTTRRPETGSAGLDGIVADGFYSVTYTGSVFIVGFALLLGATNFDIGLRALYAFKTGQTGLYRMMYGTNFLEERILGSLKGLFNVFSVE